MNYAAPFKFDFSLTPEMKTLRDGIEKERERIRSLLYQYYIDSRRIAIEICLESIMTKKSARTMGHDLVNDRKFFKEMCKFLNIKFEFEVNTNICDSVSPGRCTMYENGTIRATVEMDMKFYEGLGERINSVRTSSGG